MHRIEHKITRQFNDYYSRNRGSAPHRQSFVLGDEERPQRLQRKIHVSCQRRVKSSVSLTIDVKIFVRRQHSRFRQPEARTLFPLFTCTKLVLVIIFSVSRSRKLLFPEREVAPYHALAVVP